MVGLFKWLFGSGNMIADTAEVFRENAEAGAARSHDYARAALAQHAAEFQHARRGAFDRFMDGLNRLPRPLMVLATVALFGMAMWDPLWFAERMTGLALVPDPLWWLAGVIVTFYFGGRMQHKMGARVSAAGLAKKAPEVLGNIAQIRALGAHSVGVADPKHDALQSVAGLEGGSNQALDDWRNAKRS